MKRTIFYSWQSDLPNKSNRGFIESCIEKTIKDISKTTSFSLELNIDRDTKEIIGTPDIVDSIFAKISKSKIFIADISIINSTSNSRKCPNPNVLIELGYAVRILGWERVFCMYNLDFGTLEDLPFNLRQRRLIQYSLNRDGTEQTRIKVSKILTASIISLHKNGGLFDNVDDYVKRKVDTEIIAIASHLGKMIFGYNKKPLLDLVRSLLSLKDDELEKEIKSVELIGFQIFKSFGIQEEKFKEMADSAISSVYHNREMAAIIIELINWTARYEALNSIRNPNDWFTECNTKSKDFVVLPPSYFQKNDKLPNRYVLSKKIDKNEGIVIDYGDFPFKLRTQKLLTTFEFNSKNKETFISIIREFIKVVNNWLNLTNDEFILDLFHEFELKTIVKKVE